MSIAKYRDPITGEWRPLSVVVGATFIPVVSENGDLSWTNDRMLPNPIPVNIRGPRGEQGEKGNDGTGITIRGSFDTVELLKAAHPTGNIGDSYLVAGYLYVWSETELDWINVGNIQGPEGYTPVRGVDYWTDADKEEIKSYLDEVILGGEW